MYFIRKYATMIKRTLTLRGYMKNTPDRNIALDYDDANAYLILKSIFNKSNFAFLTTDTTLLDTDVSERTLCGALKSHLEKELSNRKIYLEFYRNGKLISKSKIFYKSSFLSKEINCCSSNPENN